MGKMSLAAPLMIAVLAAGATASSGAAKKQVMYEASACHMLYTPGQAKNYHYVCPGSHSKMIRVLVTPAQAEAGIKSTARELAQARKKS